VAAKHVLESVFRVLVGLLLAGLGTELIRETLLGRRRGFYFVGSLVAGFLFIALGALAAFGERTKA
jgi:hypothetical protein